MRLALLMLSVLAVTVAVPFLALTAVMMKAREERRRLGDEVDARLYQGFWKHPRWESTAARLGLALSIGFLISAFGLTLLMIELSQMHF